MSGTNINHYATYRPSDLPLITVAIFIPRPTPFLEEFFALIKALNYDKKRMSLFVFNKIPEHQKVVEENFGKMKNEYAKYKTYNDDNERLARQAAA